MANGTGDTPSRISVSEDTMRRILAEFKLDLFTELQKYATTAVVDALTTRIGVLERDGSIGTRDELKDHESRIRSMESQKFQLHGVTITLLFVITTLATMSWHIWG